MESVTWAQLGLHDKRCGILNVDGFFDDLLQFLRHVVAQGFIKERQVGRLIVEDDVDSLLEAVVVAPFGRVAAP
jgi:predicted Rossmann-fold nucleotide-binding protein